MVAAFAILLILTLAPLAARQKREGEERAAWEEQRTINRALLGTLQTLDDRLERLFPPPAQAAE